MVFYYKLAEIQNYSPNRALTVIGIEEKILNEQELQEQGKVELYKDCITYEGDMPFLAYPILEEGTIRPATRVELINFGLQSLNEGEYIQDNEIIQIPRPNQYAVWNEEQHIWTTDVNILPEGYILKETGELEYIPITEPFIRPVWDKENGVWKEGATEYEKLYDSYSQYLVLNNPRDFKKMEVAGVLEDYNTYLDECEKTFETYSETISEKSSPFPQPSEKLKNYFNSRKEKSNIRFENITNSSGGGSIFK